MSECLDCGAVYAENLSKCPQCGYKAKRRSPIFVMGMFILGALIVIPALMPVFGFFALNKQEKAIEQFEESAWTKEGVFQTSAPNLVQYLLLRPDKLKNKPIEIIGMIEKINIREKEGSLILNFQDTLNFGLHCQLKNQNMESLKSLKIGSEQENILWLKGILNILNTETKQILISQCQISQPKSNHHN